MNVKLKADKEICFGDVEAGAEVGNADNGFISPTPLCLLCPQNELKFYR
jgi:hypothetical protein